MMTTRTDQQGARRDDRRDEQDERAPIAARWTESADADPQVAALLGRVPAPEPLSKVAQQRIEVRLLEAAARRDSRRLGWAVWAPAGAVGLLLLLLLVRGADGPWSGRAGRVAPAEQLTSAAPAASLERVVAAAGAQRPLSYLDAVVALHGPGAAEVRPGLAAGPGGLALSAGRLEVRARTAPVSVSVPDGRVEIGPGAGAAVVVYAGRTAQVAAFVGAVAFQRGDARIVVIPGTTWSAPVEATAAASVVAAPEVVPEVAAPEVVPEVAAPGRGGAGARRARAERLVPAAAVARVVDGAAAVAPEVAAASASASAAASSAAPAVAPSPAPAPVPAAASAAATPALAPSSLAEESRLLGDALRALHKEQAPAAALAALSRYRERFPAGALLPEARSAQVEALMQLDRRGEALTELDRFATPSAELLVLRGELRAEAGRPSEALADFSAALGSARGAPFTDSAQRSGAPFIDSAQRSGAPFIERALYGRARCRARLGDQVGARLDLQQYLERFPGGRYSDVARETLGK